MPFSKIYHSILQIGLLQITIDPQFRGRSQIKHRIQRGLAGGMGCDRIMRNCERAVFSFSDINLQRVRSDCQSMPHKHEGIVRRTVTAGMRCDLYQVSYTSKSRARGKAACAAASSFV